MAKKAVQVRFFGVSNKNNYFTESKEGWTGLINGKAFKYPIVQLGVQALPGTRLLINNSSTPIIIGATGIYELDIDGLSSISSLKFQRSQLENMPDSSSIIIDYVYSY